MNQNSYSVIPTRDTSVCQTDRIQLRSNVRWSGDAEAAPLDSQGSVGYQQLLWKHKWILALSAVLCGGAALLLTQFQIPTYRAAGLVEVQHVSNRAVSLSGQDSSADAVSAASDTLVQNQVEILGSSVLIARVVDKLHLDERPEIWAGSGGNPLAQFRKPRAGGAHLPLEETVENAKAALKIVPVRGSGMIRLEFTSFDPNVASNFVNTLANEAIDQNLQLRASSAQRMSDFFARQLSDIEVKLKKAEFEVESYARSAGLSADPAKWVDTVNDISLKRMREDLIRAQSDSMIKQAQVEMVRQTSNESLPQALETPALRDYQGRLAELRRQYADLSVLLTPAHFKVKQLKAQMDELESSLAKERQGIQSRLLNEFEVAKRNQAFLAAAYARQEQTVATQDHQSLRLSFLIKDAANLRALRDTLELKVKETSLAAAMRVHNITVVDPAKPPGSPFSPNLALNLALGLASGLSAGVVLVCLKDRGKVVFQSPGEITRCLGVPELAAIPSAESAGKLEGAGSSLLRLRPRKVSSAVELSPVGSAIGESYRAALASILFGESEGRVAHVVAICSPEQGVGKSTATCNLGAALARLHPPALLIDGDMRAGRLHEIFNLPNRIGFHDLLTSPGVEETVCQAVQETTIAGLHVMTKGSSCEFPADVLTSSNLKAVLAALRGRYSRIIIDTPPASVLVDARLIARHADGVILVCRAGATGRDNALAVTERLTLDGSRILGTILNCCDVKHRHYGYSYRSGVA